VATVSDQLLFILKLCLLALLYLFFFRVVRAVWAEIRTPVTAPASASPSPPATHRARRDRRVRKAAGRLPRLVIVEPPDRRGDAVELAGELTIGRAPGCGLALDDAYASQLHARVFAREGRWMVEDLGSTNGTYLNGRRVSGPSTIHAGDRLQVGSTVMELR
jgi:hypothetical protein